MITFKALPKPKEYPFHNTEYSVFWNEKPIGTTIKSYGSWAAYSEGKYVGTFDKRKDAAEYLRELDSGREVYPTTHIVATPPMKKETPDTMTTFYAARFGEIGHFSENEVLNKEALAEVAENAPYKTDVHSAQHAADAFGEFLKESMTTWLSECGEDATGEEFYVINGETGDVWEYQAVLKLDFFVTGWPSPDVSTTHDFGDGNGPVPAHQHPNGGGWVADTAWVDKTVRVGPDAKVYDHARVYGHVSVSGEAEVFGNAMVSGEAVLFDKTEVYGKAIVRDDAILSGKAAVYGEAEVSGNATVSGNAKVFGVASVGAKAGVSNDAHVYEYCQVSGEAAVSGDAKVYGEAEVYGWAEVSGYAQVSGNAVVRGEAKVRGHAFVCEHAVVGGKAGVSGNTHASGNTIIGERTDA